MKKETKTNARSYFYTMLLTLPALSLGITLGNSDELIMGVARTLSLALFVSIVILTISRLRNAGRSGWWALTLLPPTTVLLILYCVFAPSEAEHDDEDLYIYGIRAKGAGRITAIILISIFLIYLIFLYTAFITDGM